MADLLILGAGVAGLSAAYHGKLAGRTPLVFEARDRWGGLLDHFELDGFRFDRGVHFGFSNNPYYKSLLDQTAAVKHYPEPYNYEAGRWLKHPVQNNLYPLPPEERVAAITSFLKRPTFDHDGPEEDRNYGRWLRAQFGDLIAERYPLRYTRKYWTVEAELMSTEWVGNRLYLPSLDEVLFGAMTDQTPQTYYLREMLYPEQGGYRAFLDPLAAGLDIRCRKRAVGLNLERKLVVFADGSEEHFETLASSLPLPELIEMVEAAPPAVREAAATLWATGAALVSLGFNVPLTEGRLWFYIYDEDVPAARVHAPCLKADDNAPQGAGSLQFETYFSRHKPLALGGEALIEAALKMVEQAGMASRSDLSVADYRELPYANVVFDRGMTRCRDYVLQYLTSSGVIPLGRFGCWDYLWADQSYLSGRTPFFKSDC